MNKLQTTFTCKICGMQVTFSTFDPNTYVSRKEHDSFFGMSLQSFRVEHCIENERHVNSVIVDSKGLYRGHLDAYAERLIDDQVEGYYLENVEETRNLPKKPIKFFYLYDLTSRMVLQFIEAEGINLNTLMDYTLKKIHEFRQLYETGNSFEFELADLEIQVIIEGNYALFFTLSEPNEDLKGALRRIVSQYSIEGFIQISSLILLLHIISRNEVVDFERLEKLLRTDLIRVQVKTDLAEYIPKIAERITREFNVEYEVVVSILEGKITVYEFLINNPTKYSEIGRMVEFTNRRKLLG